MTSSHVLKQDKIMKGFSVHFKKIGWFSMYIFMQIAFQFHCPSAMMQTTSCIKPIYKFLMSNFYFVLTELLAEKLFSWGRLGWSRSGTPPAIVHSYYSFSVSDTPMSESLLSKPSSWESSHTLCVGRPVTELMKCMNQGLLLRHVSPNLANKLHAIFYFH